MQNEAAAHRAGRTCTKSHAGAPMETGKNRNAIVRDKGNQRKRGGGTGPGMGGRGCTLATAAGRAESRARCGAASHSSQGSTVSNDVLETRATTALRSPRNTCKEGA
eukprot:171905-Alexandrium_andersonii.AAC.1